jgi:protein-L-isoaspartate(D-aspartate) O-methyltransferase
MDEETAYTDSRKDMVESQIQARGVKDPKVLAAMLKVKRHLFVPENMRPHAYDDNPLPIGHNQTISQPYIVALMTELAEIKPTDKILEIGTGSGYQAAILAELSQNVYTIEIVEDLAKDAEMRLKGQGYKNIEVRCGDGYQGWPEQAPFDAILVTAAAPRIPEELIKQLRPGARLVIPLGDFFQELYVITKDIDGNIRKEKNIPVRFVPMVEGKKKK